MQKLLPLSLSLSSGLFTANQQHSYEHSLVPWEVQSFSADFQKASDQGGVFDLSWFSTIEIQGGDSLDYLHRMSTLNIKDLSVGKMAYGAFLTGKGTVLSLGLFQKISNDCFHYIVPNSQLEKTLGHIEQFHFAEKFQTKDVSEEWTYLGLYNATPDLLRDLVFGGPPASEQIPMEITFRRWLSTDLEIWKDQRRPLLLNLKMRRSNFQVFLTHLKGLGVSLLGLRTYEYLRLRAGIPTLGIELSERDIILEGNFDEAVSRNKGCYPGQEVVERIFTYGQVNRKLLLVRLEVPKGLLPSCPIEFKVGEAKVGSLMSFCQEPQHSELGIGLMYVNKNYWNYEGKMVAVDGITAVITK